MNNIKACFLLISFVSGIVFATEQDNASEKYLKLIKNGVNKEEQAWILKQHEDYIKNAQNDKSASDFRIMERLTLNNNCGLRKSSANASSVTRILLLVNSDLYYTSITKPKIDRYAADIASAHGCKVELVAMNGGTCDSVRNTIKTYYNDKESGSLNGVIQIGSLPLAWFENPYDFDITGQYGEYNNFTCDLYYMDLDGTWTDTLTYTNGKSSKGKNGIFDGHIKGSGDLGPEVFYARIDPSTMGKYGSEVELLSAYLDKDHSFWTGEITLNDTAMYYLTYDWYDSENFVNCVYGAEHTAKFNYNKNNPSLNIVNANDYLTNRISYQYSILHMWCHADYNVHAFFDGNNYTDLSMEKVYSANPKPIAYFQDGCHLNDFVAGGNKAFLGGCYVFNKSPTSLVCFGGSKSGQWIGYMGKSLFTELGKNTCLGQAFQIWLSDYIAKEQPDKNDLYFTSWNYGYNIIGDPMLTFVSQNIVSVNGMQKFSNNTTNWLRSSVLQTGKSIMLSYDLNEKSAVKISLYGINGKLAGIISDKSQDRGSYSLNINLADYAEGCYIISISAGKRKAFTQLNIVR